MPLIGTPLDIILETITGSMREKYRLPIALGIHNEDGLLSYDILLHGEPIGHVNPEKQVVVTYKSKLPYSNEIMNELVNILHEGG